MDFDGNFEYSHIVEITTTTLNDNASKIYPTVARNDLNVEGGKGQVMIYNTLGQPVSPITQYENKTSIPINHLPKGQYFLHIQSDNGDLSATLPFIKID